MDSDKRNKITTFIVLLLLTTSVLYMVWTDHIHTLPKFYTIGKIEKVYSTRSSGKSIRYVYMVNEVEYKQTANLDYNLEVDLDEGLCFIVSVPKKYLKKGRLLQEYPTKSYCNFGEKWDKIPDRFKAIKVQEN